eukprot:4817219-Pyramimonas_sp.AAC.2
MLEFSGDGLIWLQVPIIAWATSMVSHLPARRRFCSPNSRERGPEWRARMVKRQKEANHLRSRSTLIFVHSGVSINLYNPYLETLPAYCKLSCAHRGLDAGFP